MTGGNSFEWIQLFFSVSSVIIPDIGEIHYHKENKTNGVKQIEFSAESNQFEKNQKWE